MTRGRRLSCLVSFASIVIGLTVHLRDCLAGEAAWPFIRGVNYDGQSHETGLVEEWPASGPPVLWSRELGPGYSSFIAWDDRVATQYQTLAGQFVVCLEADTGKTLWQHRYALRI